MNDLNLAATTSTPHVRTDWDAGVLHLSGDSYPENAFELYQPVFDWVKAYLAASDRPLHLDFALVYLNTSSVRMMMDILDTVEDAFLHGRDVSLIWRYAADNERVAELAEEFHEDCSFPFTIRANELS